MGFEKEFRLIPFSEQARPYDERMARLLASVEIDTSIEIYDELAKKRKVLEEKYGDLEVQKYEMYHVISRSGLRSDRVITEFDFPEGDSLVEFLEGLEKEYGTG